MNTQIKYIVALLVIMTGGLLWPESPFAAKPTSVTVDSAEPNSAIQGQDLEVVITGSGFDQGSTVKFLVAGTKDDSQVEISGAIIFVSGPGNSGKLTAPIHVLNAAIVDNYDIEVRASSGRRGKGTDAFRVKVNPGVVYTAELTEGAFVFYTFPGGENIVDATPLLQGNDLKSEDDLDMNRPSDGGALEATWNQVFNVCTELLVPDSVESIFVANDNWTIEKAGGVRVIFRDILLPGGDAEVRVQLIGNEFDFFDSFLPTPGNPREYLLEYAAINGSTVQGVNPRSGCQPRGGGGFDTFKLNVPSKLVITATQQ